MLQSSYEESRLNEDDVGDRKKWLKEGMDCSLLFWDGRVLPISHNSVYSILNCRYPLFCNDGRGITVYLAS